MISLVEAHKEIDVFIQRMLDEYKVKKQKYKEKADNTVLFLQESGIDYQAGSFWGLCEPYIPITKQDIPNVHKLCGTLERVSLEADGDGRNRKVKVYLKPKDKKFEHIRFVYKMQLPKGAKCKIKTVTNKYRSVVCEK